MTREAINELKKYTLGKKNTEKVEISVLQLNRVIKALEQRYNSIKTELKPCEDTISRSEVIKSIDEREDVNGKVDAESVRTDIVLIPPVNTQKCDACEVGNPCLYCRHEFEERSSEE